MFLHLFDDIFSNSSFVQIWASVTHYVNCYQFYSHWCKLLFNTLSN